MPSTAAVVATAAAVTASAAVVTASAAVVTAAEYDYEEYDYPAASVAKSVVTHVVSSFPFSTTSYVASRICVTPTDSELRNLYKVMPPIRRTDRRDPHNNPTDSCPAHLRRKNKVSIFPDSFPQSTVFGIFGWYTICMCRSAAAGDGYYG